MQHHSLRLALTFDNIQPHSDDAEDWLICYEKSNYCEKIINLILKYKLTLLKYPKDHLIYLSSDLSIWTCDCFSCLHADFWLSKIHHQVRLNFIRLTEFWFRFGSWRFSISHRLYFAFNWIFSFLFKVAIYHLMHLIYIHHYYLL